MVSMGCSLTEKNLLKPRQKSTEIFTGVDFKTQAFHFYTGMKSVENENIVLTVI